MGTRFIHGMWKGYLVNRPRASFHPYPAAALEAAEQGAVELEAAALEPVEQADYTAGSVAPAADP